MMEQRLEWYTLKLEAAALAKEYGWSLEAKKKKGKETFSAERLQKELALLTPWF